MNLAGLQPPETVVHGGSRDLAAHRNVGVDINLIGAVVVDTMRGE